METGPTSFSLVYIWKLLHVILSEAKNLCRPRNYEILRRLAPQNDIKDKVSGGKLVNARRHALCAVHP